MSWLFGGGGNDDGDDDDNDDRYDIDFDDDDVENTKVISDFDASALVEGAKVSLKFLEISINILLSDLKTVCIVFRH